MLQVVLSKMNRALFLSVCSMVVLGYKKPLEDKDLWSLNEEDTSKVIVQQLSEEWDKEKVECKR